MKNLLHFFLAAVVACLFSASAALGGGQTMIGPHSAQNFQIVKHLGGIRETAGTDERTKPPTIAVVLTVEQRMVGKEVEITAKVGAHKGGPKGELFGVDNLSVHVSQPVDFATKPATTGEARIVKTIPSAGGKFKTVVAEARMNSPKYQDALVTLTIPGDK